MKQPPQVLYKKTVLKTFAIFAGKHPCWSTFLIKLQAFSRSVFSRMQAEYGEMRIEYASKCGKIRIRKTLNTGTFYAGQMIQLSF